MIIIQAESSTEKGRNETIETTVTGVTYVRRRKQRDSVESVVRILDDLSWMKSETDQRF